MYYQRKFINVIQYSQNFVSVASMPNNAKEVIQVHFARVFEFDKNRM